MWQATCGSIGHTKKMIRLKTSLVCVEIRLICLTYPQMMIWPVTWALKPTLLTAEVMGSIKPF